MSGVSDVEVSGGASGFEVRADDLALAARALGGIGAELVAVAGGVGLVLRGSALHGSAVLDPAGAARVTAAVAAALSGPSGLGATAVAVEVRAGLLLLAAVRYRTADDLALAGSDLRRRLTGSLAVFLAPLAAGAGALWWSTTALSGGDPARDAEAFLAAHPGLVDEVAGAAPGAVSMLVGLAGPLAGPVDVALRVRTGRGLRPRSLAESAGLLALLYPHGRAGVVAGPAGGGTAPHDVGDLLDALTVVDGAARGTEQGRLVVTRTAVPGAEGTTRESFVVLLPGTKGWQPDPRSRPYVSDLATNLELMAGEPTARVEAVASALTAAGAGPDSPVMLVGHSQGGMVAMRAAAELRGSFDVSHVVTAGSPVGRMPVPDGVHVLSLENRQDVVPRLDAAPNRSSATHVTVQFDAAASGLAGEHALAEAYLPAARALSGSSDPALRGWLASAGAFLAPGPAAQVTTTPFTVVNAADPPP